MVIFKEIEPLKAFLSDKRALDHSVGLVPTMGALHSGHLELVKASKKVNSITVCSIFVNPIQFNNPADLEKYPKSLEHDIAYLNSVGCDVLFHPDRSEMYQKPTTTKFDFGQLDKVLEGEFRPGHFSGVALVVSKLFNIVNPTRAYFGQKDFQQFKIVQRIVDDLNFNIELICFPTLREADGLAMSSRNTRLSDEERKTASVFYRSLVFAKNEIRNRAGIKSINERVVEMCLSEKNVRLEYFAIADTENLNLLDNVKDADRSILLIAGFVGEVRLIDNMFVE
ncbi:MAG: pantoate--beta-alanine ligase [Bacteroidia bacterium]|nr:pantoate--beta-alanine ligase [Bacteroidia bacterium]